MLWYAPATGWASSIFTMRMIVRSTTNPARFGLSGQCRTVECDPRDFPDRMGYLGSLVDWHWARQLMAEGDDRHFLGGPAGVAVDTLTEAIIKLNEVNAILEQLADRGIRAACPWQDRPPGWNEASETFLSR
jgi:hypothetical protein